MHAARPARPAASAARMAAVAAHFLLILLASGGGHAHAQIRPNNPEQLMRQFGIASWSPAYTLQAVNADEEVASLADDGRSVWLSLMSRPRVVRFLDGTWWSAGEIDTKGVYFAYALATAGADVWAVGHEGGMARRTHGAWTTVAPVSPADLYAVVGAAADDVWAVGFDYPLNAGTILHWDGRAVQPSAGPDLNGTLLYSVALDAQGRVWIGGCTAVADPTPLVWRRDGTAWQPVSVPIAHGCVTDLAFTAAGRGLAAAGSDLLAWDGARFTAFGLPPPAANPDAEPPRPDGLQWMRVAVAERDTLEGTVVTGAAIAGRPTFRGFTDGAALWRYDGTRWTEAAVDDRGWTAAFHQADVEPPRAWLDLTARRDGSVVAVAWLPNALPEASPAEGVVGLFTLEDDALRLSHPLAGGGPGAAAIGGDVAALSGGPGRPARTWLATARGASPLLKSETGWAADAAFRFTADSGRWFLDAGGPDTAWAWRVEPRPGTTDLLSWRGGGWIAVDLPEGGGPRQVRDIGGGRLWARRDAELMVYDGRGWGRLPNAPSLVDTALACVGPTVKLPLGAACDGLVAPFDAAIGPGGGETGWLAGADGALHQWLGGRFDPEAVAVRGTVIDLQMVGPRAGWAIGRDDRASRPAGTPLGVVLRLSGGAWTEVSARDVTVPSRDGSSQASRMVDVDWRLLAAVDANEALLYGAASFQVGAALQELPVLIQIRGDRAILLLDCPLSALAAARGDRATDIWLLEQGGPRACIRSPNPRLPIRRDTEAPVTGFQQLLGHLYWAMPRTVLLPVVAR